MRHLYYSNVGVNPAVGLDKITGRHFGQDIDENIGTVLRKVENGTYGFTNYRQMLMLKGKGRAPREICIPTVRDKLTICAISAILDDVYGETCKTPQPQPVIDDVSDCLVSSGFDAFIKIDISRFYASIDHGRLLRIIRRRIRKRQLIDLIEKAISTPSAPFGAKPPCKRKEGVPEGLSISNKLANIYLSDLDAAFTDRDECKYFRYVDDILILCNSDCAGKIRSKAENILRRLSLKPNEEKCCTGSIGVDAFSYLGYTFDGALVSVRKQTIHALEHSLDGLVRKRRSFQNDKQWLWKLNLRITGFRLTEDGERYERYGWIHYYSRVNDIALLRHLDWLVAKLFRRYGMEVPDGLKSFHKAYYELRYKADATSYIPTFGASTPNEEKRRMLEEIFEAKNIDSMTDEQIDAVFNKKIRREAHELEKDVGLIS